MVVLGGRIDGGSYGAARVDELDDYGRRTCCG